MAKKSATPLRVWVKMLATTNLMTQALRRLMQERCALTLPQFDYLAQLERSGNEGLTLSQVASKLMVTGGNVTGLTDRLQNEGLVYREPDPSDRRSLRVFMTEKGAERMAVAARIHEEWINEAMSGLDRKALQSLSESFDLLRESFRSAAEKRKPS